MNLLDKNYILLINIPRKATSGLILLARYISTPLTLRYGTSRPRNSSLSSRGQKGSLLVSSDQIILGY